MVEDKVIIVTGASKGLGREIAKSIIKNGGNVCLFARSEQVEKTAEIINDSNSTITVRGDVRSEDSVEKAVNKTVDCFGSLDGLVNNAGISNISNGAITPIEATNTDEWWEVFEVNVLGPYLFSKKSIPHIKKSDDGRIINVSSISAKRPTVGKSAYSASKLALVSMSRTLAYELGRYEITVNTICPGPFQSMSSDRLEQSMNSHPKYEEMSHDQAIEELTSNQAIEKLLKEEDVANFITYLLGSGGRNITAQDINISFGSVWY